MKRQSELYGNIESTAEMTVPQDAYKDVEWFNQKYWVEGLSVIDIAKVCCRHPQTVYSWLQDHNVKIRKHTHKPHTQATLDKIGKKQKGELNHQWKGGRITTAQGYVRILKPDHPYANSSGYVLEHRLVMEEVLGRYLDPNEVVHHKDKNRSNNLPDNLEVFGGKVTHERRKLTCPHCNHTIFL